MTRVFVFTNHKGGVGKSTSAANIAFGIVALLKKGGASNPRVLLIDTDSQAHATLVTTGRKNYGVERATWLLRDFIPDYTGDGMIPCIVIPARQSSIFRQAKENTVRAGLTAIALFYCFKLLRIIL